MTRSATSAWGHMTGAAGLVDCLRRAGIRRAFGLPAVENSWLFDAFSASPVEIVVATHPQAAAFMANAHARLTGEPAACLLPPGPGLAQSLAGIAQARADSSPMVVVVASGGPGRDKTGSDAEARSRQLAMAEPLCKRVYLLDEPEQVPAVMASAIRLARAGQPGPVLLDMPMDVQRGRARMEGTGFSPAPRVLSGQAGEGLAEACRLIEAAKQVGFYVGAGCFAALDEVRELADRLDAPVATTISGLGALPWIHPLAVGFGPGPAGNPLAGEALGRCDLILAVGCRFSEAASGGFSLRLGAKLVHVDVDSEALGLNLTADLAVCAPAKQALRFLLDRVAEVARPGMRELIRAGKRTQRRKLQDRPQWTDAVDPIKFFLALREVMGTEDVVILDAGHHALFGLAAYPVQAPRTLLTPVDYHAPGYSVPAAVAAKLLNPDGRVVACVGDGGFLRAGTELLTARRCNLAPVVAVFADGRLDLLRSFQKRVFGRETAVELAPVDYDLWAQSMGVKYLRIAADAELEAGLKRALTLEAPVVLEVRVAYREVANYLEVLCNLEQKRMPRAASLRLGARQILRKILRR